MNCINCNIKLTVQKKFCSNKCQAVNTNKVLFLAGTKSSKVVRHYLLFTFGNKCFNCKNDQWMGKPITVEADHIDGNSENNILDNLRLLCPNCHAQTDTYRTKNIGNGRANRRKRYKEGKSY
jgi:hypothetical protein